MFKLCLGLPQEIFWIQIMPKPHYVNSNAEPLEIPEENVLAIFKYNSIINGLSHCFKLVSLCIDYINNLFPHC
jgi:hypothetical protein